MPKRLLAIGVGGSGKAALTIYKERLEETYGKVPDNVVLLAVDTDDLRPVDVFAGTRLQPNTTEGGREGEFCHIVSRAGVTMDTIFADIAAQRTSAYMAWLEKEKLSRSLSPSERDIRGGAQQRRPVGRVAVFQRWSDPIYTSIVGAITRMYGDPETERPVDAVRREQSKRQIFIVGSVAGGTGSGSLIDVVNLVRHAVASNPTRWQSVDVAAVIVLPDAFSSYASLMDDPTNLKPNSYAALRELDRFIRTHSNDLPYMIRYGDDLRSITWSTNQPLDHVYLIDTASPSSLGDSDLSGDLMRGVFPLIADFIMAHTDQSLGDALATLRSNAGQHYDKEEGRNYSSFNVLTYIFPVDDVIESFSYQLLRDVLARQFLPLADRVIAAQVEQEALTEVERLFATDSIGGKVIPGVVQKAIAATRRVTPEAPDVSWRGLFNMIALSDESFVQDYAALEDWLKYLRTNLTPTKDEGHKQETYSEGYTRLLNFSDQFMEDCLGPRIDPHNEEARLGGEWDKILGRYREALRQRFAEALDAAVLEVMNRRDPVTRVLLAARLPVARAVAAALRDKLVRFRAVLDKAYRELDPDVRLRQASEEVRNDLTWMHDTRETKPFLPLGKPDARKAQEAFITAFSDKMELLLHQRILRVVLDVLDALGAADRDSDQNRSVVDLAALELETWQATLVDVDTKFLIPWLRAHKKNRKDKEGVKARRYLTDPAFEEALYGQPGHAGMVLARVLGEVQGQTGLLWRRREADEPLSFKLVSIWTEEASGAQDIATKFFNGVKGLFQVVRKSVTAADRVAASFASATSFVNVASQVSEPFLRYNPAANGQTLGLERYVSFNNAHAGDAARNFLDETGRTLGGQGLQVDAAAESLVACTVVEVSRGARLRAVDQFIACEPEYRGKLHRGKESLHLFTEEQVATVYEGQIDSLSEPNNHQRPLAPELVIAMGDEVRLKAFILACAYGLVETGLLKDKEGAETTEIFLNLMSEGEGRRFPLSQSVVVRQLDPVFDTVTASERTARLTLNALQNFVLKVTQKPGVPGPMVAELVGALQRRGVSLQHIENPFTLPVRAVYDQIRRQMEAFGPTEVEEVSRQRREALNAKRRAEALETYLKTRVVAFKQSPAQRVMDMGTVMHLVLKPEISQLRETALGV